MHYIPPYVSSYCFTCDCETSTPHSHRPATQNGNPGHQDGNPLPNFPHSPNPSHRSLRPRAQAPKLERSQDTSRHEINQPKKNRKQNNKKVAKQGVRGQKRGSRIKKGSRAKAWLGSGSDRFTKFWVMLGVEGFEELGDGMAVHGGRKRWVDDEAMDVDREVGSWVDSGMALVERVEAWRAGDPSEWENPLSGKAL